MPLAQWRSFPGGVQRPFGSAPSPEASRALSVSTAAELGLSQARYAPLHRADPLPGPSRPTRTAVAHRYMLVPMARRARNGDPGIATKSGKAHDDRIIHRADHPPSHVGAGSRPDGVLGSGHRDTRARSQPRRPIMTRRAGPGGRWHARIAVRCVRRDLQPGRRLLLRLHRAALTGTNR